MRNESPSSTAKLEIATSTPEPFVITFEEAIAGTQDLPRHLLLGNGFSIAGHSGFRYEVLKERAADYDRDLPQLFDQLGAGSDFELAMRLSPNQQSRERIRHAFLETITGTHPKRSDAVGHLRREACADFLGRFTRHIEGPPGRVFTTNYDLMLAWVLAEHRLAIGGADGFGAKSLWHEETARRSNVLYLHGALHIFPDTTRKHYPVKKLVADWENDESLVARVRDAVNAGAMPVFVSEGTWEEKADRINRSLYLTRVWKILCQALWTEQAVFFTAGHRLSDVDQHLLTLIGKGRFKKLYVGVHSDSDLERAHALGMQWSEKRRELGQPPLRTSAYWTREARVWG